MNRKIETFKRFLVMQKTLVKFMHRKSWIERHWNIWRRSL